MCARRDCCKPFFDLPLERVDGIVAGDDDETAASMSLFGCLVVRNDTTHRPGMMEVAFTEDEMTWSKTYQETYKGN